MSIENFEDDETYCYAEHKNHWWRMQRGFQHKLFIRIKGAWVLSEEVEVKD